MTLPGLAPAPTTIVFGTDGWRARIADEFTYDNVRRCADGVAAYVVERGETAPRPVRPPARSHLEAPGMIGAALISLSRRCEWLTHQDTW